MKNSDTGASEGRRGVFRHFTLPKAVSGVLICAAFAFSVFFFSPMEIVMNNRQDFTVNASDILKPMLLLSFAVTAGLSAVILAALTISDKLFFVLSRLVMGVTLALYFQAMFLNGGMKTLTGDGLYKVSAVESVLNMISFAALVILPLAVNILYRDLKKRKGLQKENGFLKVLPAYLCGALIVMQGFGFSDTYRKTSAADAEKTYDKALSYIPFTSFSKENNVVLFLVDRFDSKWCDELLESYPELYDKLSGFTFYQNNISHYSNTFPSVPSMFTGLYYDNYKGDQTSKKDYLTDAWNRTTLFDTLTENGIKVNLSIDSFSTVLDYSQLEGRCSNLYTDRDPIVGFNCFGSKGILNVMSKLSMGRLAPYCLKSFFAGDLGSDLSEGFVNYDQDIVESVIPSALGVGSDKSFYSFVGSHSFNADSDSPVFDFIHLNGAHTKDEEISAFCESNAGKETDIYTTTRGELEIVFRCLDKMKEIGVYDNTTVIIFADHGRVNLELDVDGKDHMEHENVSTLMIKPAGASSEPLKLDPESELTNDYMSASVLEYFGIDHSSLGYSFSDIVDGGLHIDRIFNPFRWRRYNDFNALNKYRVTGDARDFSNWTELTENS